MTKPTLYTITDKASGRKAAGTFTIEQVCAALDHSEPEYVETLIARNGEFSAVDDSGARVIVRPV